MDVVIVDMRLVIGDGGSLVLIIGDVGIQTMYTVAIMIVSTYGISVGW